MNKVLLTDKYIFGGDYNPDQWLNMPEILDKDIEMFKEANINCVSLAIFAWSKLEPTEGNYDFDWLEDIINKLYKNGIYTILATPSAARPKWLADKYPEVMRVNIDRRRQLFGMRHNHCQTSKVYREKVASINEKLAERFKDNEAIILWHINNEYGGECYCDTCQNAFRDWLKDRYKTIENLNDAWCTQFWSHTYNDFSQVEAPGTMDNGEWAMNPLLLNWKRFATYITVDFMKAEVDAVRKGGSNLPVTTNFMYDFGGYNYKKFMDIVDIVSWDNYSRWHKYPDIDVAYDTAFQHDLMRSYKKAPFLLMESCPTAVNWQSVSKLRWPGVLEAAGMQAIAHGSDSVQYFQMRQSRAGMEKFHGALIDHYGKSDTRIFNECKNLGTRLDKMGKAAGGEVKAEVGLIYDRENIWAMESSFGPRNKDLGVHNSVMKMYTGIRRQNVNVDIIDCEDDLTSYKLIVAPMLYMFRTGIEEKIRSYVENGGTVVMTYWCGQVDEDDRTFLQETPHGLCDVLGLRHTEIDGLYDDMIYHGVKVDSDSFELDDLKEKYTYSMICNLVELSTAKTLMNHNDDFYAGTPVVTVNQYGEGNAYFVGADFEKDFYVDFMKAVSKAAGISPFLSGDVPECVEVSSRMIYTGEKDSEGNDISVEKVFIQNFSKEEVSVKTDKYDGMLKAYETVVV